MKYLLLIIILVIMTSCKTSRELHDKENIENNFIASEMKENGFMLGIIAKSDEDSNCEYIIHVNEEIQYDPINLSDEFKTHNLEVWFKFIGLRRVNRCPNVSPIRIIEMIKKQKLD